MKLKSLLFFFLLITSFGFAQDDEKKSTCPEPENKKAVDFYKKGIDKKKNPKPERLKYLQQAIALEPTYAEANIWEMKLL